MLLTEKEEAMARGDLGPGIQKCMEILIKFGEAVGAEKLARITSAHTMPKEPPALLQEMTEGVGEIRTFTTLHSLMAGFSPESWKKMGLPESFVETEFDLHKKRTAVYSRCGFFQTYTCLPMLVGNLPRKGELVSWIGTGAQLLANSIIGARCNRDGTIVNLAAAVTGRAPLWGLFLDENRKGDILVRLKGLGSNPLSHAQLGAIGYHIGGVARSRNVVIDGLPRNLDMNQIKYLMAPLAVSGSVSLCHIVGLTPEAPTLDAAFGGQEPKDTLIVGPEKIRESFAQYEDGDPEVDMAIFGCPHCTATEVKYLAKSLSGRRLAGDKRLWIGMPHQHYHLARLMGDTAVVESAGGVFASSCMATIPEAPIPEGVKVIATNSFKAAHYISRLTKGAVKVLVGDMDRCVDAVTGGKWRETEA
jgi:hypothetical protein